MRAFAFCALWLTPALLLAQPSFPTTFAADAAPLGPEALRERLAGKTYFFKPVVGDPVRIQYQETYVFANVGNASDTGKWRVEGSTVCVEWRKFPSSCTEARLVGDALYMKRASTGEVVLLQAK